MLNVRHQPEVHGQVGWAEVQEVEEAELQRHAAVALHSTCSQFRWPPSLKSPSIRASPSAWTWLPSSSTRRRRWGSGKSEENTLWQICWYWSFLFITCAWTDVQLRRMLYYVWWRRDSCGHSWKDFLSDNIEIMITTNDYYSLAL